MSWPNHQTHVHMALWLYFLSLENRLLLTESHKGAAHWALTVSICMSLASTPCAIHHHLCKQPAIPFALTTIFFFFWSGYPIISCLLGRVFLFATQNLFHWPASTRCHLRVCEKCSLLSLALHLWNQDSCFIRSPQVLTRWSGEELQLYLAELLSPLPTAVRDPLPSLSTMQFSQFFPEVLTSASGWPSAYRTRAPPPEGWKWATPHSLWEELTHWIYSTSWYSASFPSLFECKFTSVRDFPFRSSIKRLTHPAWQLQLHPFPLHPQLEPLRSCRHGSKLVRQRQL